MTTRDVFFEKSEVFFVFSGEILSAEVLWN